jgi:hypothetical protein
MIGENSWLQRDSWRFVAGIAGLAMILYLILVFFAGTPKARLNVMQVVSTLLFIVVIIRCRLNGRQGTAGSSTHVEERPGMHSELSLAVLLSAGIYASTLPCYFISDDFAHLFTARGPVLTTLWHLLTEGQSGLFLRPVGFASLFFDYHLWYHWPPGYHLMNLLLHLSCALGTFFLCKNLGLGPQTSATASLIFSILPIHPEAVVWIAARFDLLATSLMIWAMVLYLIFRKTGRIGSYFGAIGLLFLAMLSKETAYVFPLLLIAMEFFAMPRIKTKWPVLGVVLLTAMTFCYRGIVLGGIGGYWSPTGYASALDIGPKTLEGLFVRAPSQLLLGYNWLQPSSTAILLLASLTAAVLLAIGFGFNTETSRYGRRGLIWFSLVWIPLAYLPAHFLILIDSGLTNSRILYLSSVGAAIFIALLLAGIGHRGIRQGLKLILVLLLSLGLIHNLRAWRWTSELSHRFLMELKHLEPSPPPRAEFVFREMPDTIRGVFFFHAGLTEAVNLVFDRQDLRARRESCPLPGPLIDAATRPTTPSIKIDWVGGIERLIERAKEERQDDSCFSQQGRSR